MKADQLTPEHTQGLHKRWQHRECIPLCCWQARVSVVGPLPLVEARVEVPASSVAPQDEAGEAASAATPTPPAKRDGKSGTSGPEPAAKAISATALKGQVLNWWLSVANTGAHPY